MRPDPRPLRGRSVVTTRERPGRLDSMLAARGADVVHVPLIRTVDPADGGAELSSVLAEADRFDWVVVTSPVGAERVLPAFAGRRARIATVGSRTAEIAGQVTGRPVDVVPERQFGAALVEAMPDSTTGAALLLAVADRADPDTATALADRGYRVTAVTAYRTVLREPTWRERRAALAADVVAFASGSAARSWSEAIGSSTPPAVVSIGPSTTHAATEVGLQVHRTAADHSLDGLVDAIIGHLETGP